MTPSGTASGGPLGTVPPTGPSRGEGPWLAVLAGVSLLALVALALALSGHL